MQASYAMGYNLAVEYLADFEKTWMLESFKELDARVLQPQQRDLKEWLFLEVRHRCRPPRGSRIWESASFHNQVRSTCSSGPLELIGSPSLTEVVLECPKQADLQCHLTAFAVSMANLLT